MLRRQLRNARRLLSIARYCRRLTPACRPGYFPLVLRAARLCSRERFTPVEAFRLGLFRPDLRPQEASKYVSRKKLTKVQEALNPPSWAFLAKDKGIFYRYCMAAGVPVPTLYAVLFRAAAGWSCNGAPLAGREDWTSFVAARLPAEFVIKPACGAYGHGLNILHRSGGGFVDASGRHYDNEKLYEAMLSQADERGMLIQERLKNHGELVRLSGTDSLQTVRLITLLGGDGSCRILHAHLKPIVGQHLVDTFIDGLTGNVEAPVDLDRGVLAPANQVTGGGAGIKTIPAHPETGVSFEGFKLPLWEEACELARRAAVRFLPLRTIGWDVALTPDGACIVEGNVWWDPPNQHGRMARLFETLKAELR